jgi:hypothetical protein
MNYNDIEDNGIVSIVFSYHLNAIRHAEQFGGWVYQSDDGAVVVWYRGGYGMSNIIKDTSAYGNGFIATYDEARAHAASKGFIKQ